MEYVEGGELFHYVDDMKGIPEDQAVYIFRQIISALLYCHRLLICHRDLKPENILLDRRDLSVKLIDFGMAALQPEGKLLSTPCGSPHYAAPEVVIAKPYDGTQADVWSCGVILYVMLTATSPFNYPPDGNLRALFHDICRANYYLPSSLTSEAKDLLRRIFVVDPGKRTTMDEVWDHPFVHKYDKTFGFVGERGTKQFAVGKAPKIDSWKIKRIQDIDREILRNMRTLWHSEPENSLIQKLVNDEYNQEKLFYAALVKHREEHLENYCGEADDIGYSASDYHHSHPPKADEAPPLPANKAERSQSQYSIMNDEHLHPSNSFIAPPPSMSSYDPYRASKDPLVTSPGDYVNITVHRNGTNSTRRLSKGRNLRHPNSTRIETLKQVSRRASTNSSSSLQRSARSRPSMQRSSMSRHSLNSSMMPSSPPVIATMRPSDVHRRNVSFGHLRRISTASALTAQESTKGAVPETPPVAVHPREHRLKAFSRMQNVAESSPTMHADHGIKSRKERAGMGLLETPRMKARNPNTPGHHMRSEIRKHSAELEKACEEAFQIRESFGSSMTAKSQTSATDKQSPYDTPPSSVYADTPELPTKTASRPLPEPPKDTPNTYLTRTLEETRKKLAAYKGSGDDNAAKFEEVMKLLDHIMPGSGPSPEKRTTSAPEASKTQEYYGLPIISEEGSDQRSSRDGTNWRSVTAPVTMERRLDDKTIRVVQPSSPGTVAPLNIRKTGSSSPGSDDTFNMRKPSAKASTETLGRKRTNEPSHLMAIDEDSTLLTTPTIVRKKRSGWFGRAKKDSDPVDGDTTLVSATDDTRPSRLAKVATNGRAHTQEPASSSSSEFPFRKHRLGGGKNGFSKWIGKMSRDKGVDSTMTDAGKNNPPERTLHRRHTHFLPDTTVIPNESLASFFSAASPSPSSDDAPPTSGDPERSWFARFFNIKPASQIICFSINRSRARQELAILLKEWQSHGISDLEYSRENNTIVARVDKNNTLNIKPVTFRIEMFVVLSAGVKVGMSIARFVQVKGAVSGFRKVLEVVDGVMRGRGWLVEDEDTWKALCEVVGG
jgi:serine/threonine protein kinase